MLIGIIAIVLTLSCLFFQQKTEAIVKKLNIPVQVFAATGKTIYRKPMTGMWNYLCEHVSKQALAILHISAFLHTFLGDPSFLVGSFNHQKKSP